VGRHWDGDGSDILTGGLTRPGNGGRAMGFILKTIATAVTLAIVAMILPDIDYGNRIETLIVVAVLFGLVNALVRPVVKVLALPLNLMTFGLFGIVINAALLLLVAFISNQAAFTFSVGGFPPDFDTSTIAVAVIGGVLISIVGAVVNIVVPD
jgi:putative membrane protein